MTSELNQMLAVIRDRSGLSGKEKLQNNGKLWWRIGWVILVPSIIIHLPFYGASDDAIGIVGLILTFMQIAVLIGSNDKLKYGDILDKNINRGLDFCVMCR